MIIDSSAAAAAGTAAGAAPSASPAAAANNMADQLDRDTFLKLMVAQLRNQDPLNPTDSAQFLAQTAQFTSLEKLGSVADQGAQALSAQMAFGASSLVGRTVTYTAPDGTEAQGSVGSVRFTPTGPMLEIGDAEVPVNSLTGVLTGAEAASSTTATKAGTGGTPSTDGATSTDGTAPTDSTATSG